MITLKLWLVEKEAINVMHLPHAQRKNTKMATGKKCLMALSDVQEKMSALVEKDGLSAMEKDPLAVNPNGTVLNANL